MSRSEPLRQNPLLLWDYCLGLRGTGLVVYGALPASLGALGAVKAPDQGTLQLSLPGLPLVVSVALAPLLLTFLLTRQRLATWYLLDDCLLLRSTLVTLAIVAASTMVCLGTRALTKPDIGVAFEQWFHQNWPDQLNAVWHALLINFAYLVGSSTLFLTVIKEDSGLPLLPKKDWLAETGDLRKCLARTVAVARAWPLQIPGKTIAARRAELQETIAGAVKSLDGLRRSAPGLGHARLYDSLAEELAALASAVADVAGGGQPAWEKYWTEAPPSGLNAEEASRRTLVRRHARLSIRG
jgi:hypothetical protein